MEFLFGLVTFWFVLACALFAKDSGRHKYLMSYLLWPLELWRFWP